MQSLNLPSYNFRIKKEKGKSYVFDVWRKKWVALNPEEWVRQNFLRFLVESLNYPISALGVEVAVDIMGRRMRADALVYDKFGDRIMLLEFKAPSVDITETVFAQAADYNTKVGARYIIVSNGQSHFCAIMEGKTPVLMNTIPDYTML